MMTWERIAGGYERNVWTGKIRATAKYGTFGKIHSDEMKKLKACSIDSSRKCTFACRKLMSRKITSCMRAGKSQKQAIAIGYSEARERGCPYAKLSKVV